jgi:hypothetical protein
VYAKFKPGLVISFTLNILFAGITYSQQEDYKSIFGDDWNKAELFIKDNEAWMAKLSRKYDVPYKVAVAVIFPELIRYSAILDKMETAILKTLYINLGEDYADFSIGHFQMKPSFAESVNKMIPLLNGRIITWFNNRYRNDYLKEFRRQIVQDLENPENQYIYLLAFIRICETRYNLVNLDETNRIKFLATAYNYSFQKNYHEVYEMMDKKFFNTGLLKGEYYSYSDISVYWFTTYNVDQSKKIAGNLN